MMKQPYKENCKWYDYWQDMGARIPICKAGKNMDESGTYLMTCDGCKEYGSKYVITNADNIRHMTDEELACFLEIVANGCIDCPMIEECTYDPDDVNEEVHYRLKWLKQEA